MDILNRLGQFQTTPSCTAFTVFTAVAIVGCGSANSDAPGKPGAGVPVELGHTGSASPETGTTQPKGSTPPAKKPSNTAPSAKPETTKEMDVSIGTWGLVIDEAKGKVTYEPYRGVKQAYYPTYEFNLAEFKAVLGAENVDANGLKTPVKLRVLVLSDTSRNFTPKDPNMQSPMGGFAYQTIVCKPIKLLPAE
jgi:hypothetical protein